MIGTGRANDRELALSLGAQTFVDLDAEDLRQVGEVDVVLDVIGGDILRRSTELVRRAAPWSPSPCRPSCSRRTVGPSSSSSNPIVPG
ncbi:hypothetical protein NKG94_13490 [Micromonospora sp. M12]